MCACDGCVCLPAPAWWLVCFCMYVSPCLLVCVCVSVCVCFCVGCYFPKMCVCVFASACMVVGVCLETPFRGERPKPP